MGKPIIYVIPLIELRRAIYRACEETFADKKIVDFMFNHISNVVEDQITSSCHEYDPDKVELKVRLKQ